MNIQPLAYRPKDFSNLIGVPVRTLAHWRVYRSDGPVFCKIGGCILYPVLANQKWLDAMSVRSTSQVA